jgi:soluble lytic murein transglycosylase
MEFHFTCRPRKMFRSSWLLLAILAFPLCASSATTTPAPAITAQRAQFIKAYALAKKGDSGWKQAARGLTGYALYPYLPAAALEHDLSKVSLAQVQAYLARWPQLPPGQELQRNFLHELARRRDWKGFALLYHPGLGNALACNALTARLASGSALTFDRDLAPLWRKPSLPSDCDPVLDWAHNHGLLDRKRIWMRIDTAVDSGRGGTVAAMAKWLHGLDAIRAQHLALALREPALAVQDAMHWPDHPRNRAAAAIALRGLSRKDSASAEQAWTRLRHRLHFTRDQRDRIEHDLALFRATNFTTDAIAKLRALPDAAQSPATRGWRLRVALARRDWPAVLRAWNAMPKAQREDDEWRYFHARALAHLGQRSAAHDIYAALARETSYFGFLAADRLHQPYSICPVHPSDNPSAEKALLKRPGLDRAFELFAVDLPAPARREWSMALQGADARTLQLAGMLAWKRGWYHRAISEFSYGPGLHFYTQRFPLVPQDNVTAQSLDAHIDPAWAYAIIRAESAWQSDAHSGADAYGLMQLVPRTARRMARALNLPYQQPENLYNARLNVALGTHYLHRMATRYDGAPWLATAAYNAGPVQVDQWLDARGALPPDLFVATIPYHETREYVARVMTYSVVYDWRLHQRTLSLSKRMPRFGAAYAPPDSDTPRKPVRCAFPDTGATAPTSTP